MKDYALIVDNFIDAFDELRHYCDHATYEPTVNPYDGLIYPGICQRGPVDLFQRAINRACGPAARLVHGVLRLSIENAPAPYQAHSDDFMKAGHTVIIYLNRPEHCRGGTALLRHKTTGYERNVGDDWKADESTPDAWQTTLLCPMKTNRAFIFDSNLLHRSEPITGFGSTPQDGRLVFVGMF